ncbi:hypothetical protein J8M01_03900 [Pseudoalteromonas sp. MMG005]|nr:hypothetical protein [Pseudoalteromonas sp. MMG005]
MCPANYCSSNFYTLLNKMDTSQALRALKKAWKADIVLFIHNVYDPYNQVSGLAHIPTNPHDTTFKHVANGVAGYLSNYKVYPAAHELFHLIGAQHSKHNKKPGPLGHRAYIGSTKERNGDINGYRSFMAYEDVCKKATKGPYCQRYERISSRSTYVDLYGKRVPLGNSHDDNKNAVLNLLRTVQKFGC